MPRRTDVCIRCNNFNCSCGDPVYEEDRNFDHRGAICDLMTLIEEKAPDLLDDIDEATKTWHAKHEAAESECIKKEALAKLSTHEKHVLGLTDKGKKKKK